VAGAAGGPPRKALSHITNETCPRPDWNRAHSRQRQEDPEDDDPTEAQGDLSS